MDDEHEEPFIYRGKLQNKLNLWRDIASFSAFKGPSYNYGHNQVIHVYSCPKQKILCNRILVLLDSLIYTAPPRDFLPIALVAFGGTSVSYAPLCPISHKL